MKNKIVSLGLGLIALIAATGGAARTQADSWAEYHSADNSFAVSIPNTFQVAPHQLITPMGPVSAPLFSEQEDGNSYFVSYVDLPGSYLATTPEQRILESSISSALQSQGATLKIKSDLGMGAIPGKDFTGTVRSYRTNGQDAVMHARVYLSNGRLYLVYVTGSPAAMNTQLASRYLESFRILKDVARR